MSYPISSKFDDRTSSGHVADLLEYYGGILILMDSSVSYKDYRKNYILLSCRHSGHV